MTTSLATEASKTTLENSVSWFLADKMGTSIRPIATNKYLTNDNLLVFITKCDVADSSAPRIKVQIFKRIDGGVHEANFQLFMDHRFIRSETNMVFGVAPENAPLSDEAVDVTEDEAQALITQVNALANARLTA